MATGIPEGTAGPTPAERRIMAIVRSGGLHQRRDFVSPSQQLPAPNPSRLSTIPAGQNPVTADWMRLTPTKQVRKSHFGPTKWAKDTLIKIIDPASTRIMVSVVMESKGREGFKTFMCFYDCMLIE
jgi:hypothetical protein